MDANAEKMSQLVKALRALAHKGEEYLRLETNLPENPWLAQDAREFWQGQLREAIEEAWAAIQEAEGLM